MKTITTRSTTSVTTTLRYSDWTKLAHIRDTTSMCPQYKPLQSIPSYQQTVRRQQSTKHYGNYSKDKIFNGNQCQIKQYLHKWIMQYLIQKLQATFWSRVHLLLMKISPSIQSLSLFQAETLSSWHIHATSTSHGCCTKSLNHILSQA